MSAIKAVGSSEELWVSWVARPTPDIFELGSPWTLVQLDKNQRIVRSMTVIFTDEITATCTSGDWRKIELSGTMPTSPFSITPKPAYLLQGSALWIDFRANICDSQDSFVGELTDQGFTGRARRGGMLGYTDHGPVRGTPANTSDAER